MVARATLCVSEALHLAVATSGPTRSSADPLVALAGKGDCNAVCNPRCCQKICTCGFHEDDERFPDDNRPPPVSQSGASAQGGTYEAKQMHPPPQAQA